jgi:RNA polymerase sigma factor (sigma-70 family)
MSEREEPTLRDLSARALAGDHEAFEQIHRRVGAGLRRLLLRRSGGREDLVDDLCQKTWGSVWKALSEKKYDPERAAITTFVYAVANNAWMTHLRGFARDQGYVEGAPAMLDSAHAEHAASTSEGLPDEVWAEAETVECVRACLREDGPGGLTDLERAVVRAIAAGESDRGLARRLGVSSSTVNVRKHAGYEKIKAYLASRGIGVEDGAVRVKESEAPGAGPDGPMPARLAVVGIAGRLP